MDSQAALLDLARVTPSLKCENYELRFDPEDLDDLFIEKAAKELRESPEVVSEALAEIRRLVKGETNLQVSDDDSFYTKFLRPCKWYPEPAFQLIKNLFHYRQNHSRLCDNLVPSAMRIPLSSSIITPLPIRCKDGVRVMLIEGGKKWKPKEVSLDEVLRGVMIVLEAAISEPRTQVSGTRVILDMDGLSLSQVTYFTPSFASSVLEWVQKCLPTRLKGVHIVNQPYIFNMVFAIFKPFFQEKLRKRIHFHGTDRKSLLAYIDASVLPKQLGGEFEMPTEPIGEALWEYFCKFEPAFAAANNYGYAKKSK